MNEDLEITLGDGYRTQVAEYLLAQLHLVADLCLDRKLRGDKNYGEVLPIRHAHLHLAHG